MNYSKSTDFLKFIIYLPQAPENLAAPLAEITVMWNESGSSL